MRKELRRLSCGCILLTVLLGSVAAPSKAVDLANYPPLIDRELFFGNPEISEAQISPDGKYMAFLKPWMATQNIWVKTIKEPFGSARLLTTERKRPVVKYLWTRDSKYILYIKDNNGNENFNVFAVEPSANAVPGTDAPPVRNLTGLKGVHIELINAPDSDPDILFIGLNDRDKAWPDLYRLRISTGQKTLVRLNTERIVKWIFDRRGNVRLATRVAENGDQEILRVGPTGFSKVYSCSVFETCRPLRFSKDNRRLYLITNRGNGIDLTTLALLDSENGKLKTIEADPLKRVDCGSVQLSESTGKLLFTTYIDDRIRRYFKDKQLEADYKWLQQRLPNTEIGLESSSLDEHLWLVNAHSDIEPGKTYLFDRNTKSLSLQYTVRARLPREFLAPMTCVRYRSSDGLEITAYLTIPKDVQPKNLPTLVIPHGGPWSRDYWGFNPLAQFFANRGYVVLMPNFRGSAGYGKRFLNAGNGEWGRKMQDDITWGVKYLESEGISDPQRVGIFGASYGGYAVLAGLTFTPDIYRAAVDLAGPANLSMLLKDIPPYWEAIRKVMYTRMADPRTPAGKTWLEERSPINFISNIKAPLMVVQGANDPRINRKEAEQIVVALRDRRLPVEYLLAPDEGHGFARPVNASAMLMGTEEFLAIHLGGRYQINATPEVSQKLKQITINPKSVVISNLIKSSH